MGWLEDLRPGAWVRGLVEDRAVRVVRVEWDGRDAVVLSWEDADGDSGIHLLSRGDEEHLSVETDGSDDAGDAEVNVDRFLFDMRVDLVRVVERAGYRQWVFREHDGDAVGPTGWVTIHDDGSAGLTFLGLAAGSDPGRLVRLLPPPISGGRFEVLADGAGERIRLVHRIPAELFAVDPDRVGALFRFAQLSAGQVRAPDAEPFQGAKAYDDLVATFVANGLAVPPVPTGQRLCWLGSWWWGTTIIPPLPMYMFDCRPLVQWWDRRPAMVVCHEGHGVNSYGLNLFFADGPVAAFVQYGWGGAYTNPHRAAGRVATGFSRVRALPRHPTGHRRARSRYLLLYSEFRGDATVVDLASGDPVAQLDQNDVGGQDELEQRLFDVAADLAN